MNKMKTLIYIISILLPLTLESQGFDVTYYHGDLTLDDFTCFQTGGFDLVVLQLWTSEGYNKFFNSNYRFAKDSPIENVDAYAFICNQCKDNDPVKLCDAMYRHIPNADSFNGTLWLNIGPCEGCWSDNGDKNLQFIQDTIDECQKKKGFQSIGIYSSFAGWGNVLKSAQKGTEKLQKLPLWYIHYDNEAGFDDFSQVNFGGWKSNQTAKLPTMKQYGGVSSNCGILVNVNFRN